MPTRLNIDLVNRQRGFRLNRRKLLSVAHALLRSEGVRACDVEIAVVGDAEIAELNERYLGHRGATDVLSFDLSEPAPAVSGIARRPAVAKTQAIGRQVVGQVVVSADTARRSAAELGHAIIAELAIYVIHGLLHLLGYDDLAEPARTRMHARQRELALRLGFHLKG